MRNWGCRFEAQSVLPIWSESSSNERHFAGFTGPPCRKNDFALVFAKENWRCALAHDFNFLTRLVVETLDKLAGVHGLVKPRACETILEVYNSLFEAVLCDDEYYEEGGVV